MDIEYYKVFALDIELNIDPKMALLKYTKLTQIFVQDCALDLHQPYFGNITKEKAKILNYLSTHFDYPERIILR